MPNSVLEQWIQKTRKKINITLLPGTTDLLIPEKYPWKADTVPVYLKTPGEYSDVCYTSGGRSGIKLAGSYFFKAKSIGPFEGIFDFDFSSPDLKELEKKEIEKDFNIMPSYDGHTLTVRGISDGINPHGFSNTKEVESEVRNISKMQEYNFSLFFLPKVIGTGRYQNAVLQTLRDSKTKKADISVLFLEEESDLRVDEVLDFETLNSPNSFATKYKAYVEWVGMYVGRILREVHDTGIVLYRHNASLGNFLISEEMIGICDLSSVVWGPEKIRKKRELQMLLENSGILEKPMREGYAGNYFDVESSYKREAFLTLVNRN